jgi:hypothetical protein
MWSGFGLGMLFSPLMLRLAAGAERSHLTLFLLLLLSHLSNLPLPTVHSWGLRQKQSKDLCAKFQVCRIRALPRKNVDHPTSKPPPLISLSYSYYLFPTQQMQHMINEQVSQSRKSNTYFNGTKHSPIFILLLAWLSIGQLSHAHIDSSSSIFASPIRILRIYVEQKR